MCVFLERRLKPRKRILARVALDNDLRDHRIVERRHFRAALHPCFDARPGRPRHVRQATGSSAGNRDPDPRRKGEPGSRRRAERWIAASVAATSPAACRTIHLDEIDADDLFRHAVLDLQPRVDLEGSRTRSFRRRKDIPPCRRFRNRPIARDAALYPKARRASIPADAERGVSSMTF